VTVMEVRDGKISRWHDYSHIGHLIDNAPQW
jgi:limonene-1,2-epoxide hydrolase